MFRDLLCLHTGAYILGPCLHARCAHTAWADSGGRNDALSTGGQCLAHLVGGDHWSNPARNGARPQSRTCVDTWSSATSGDSFKTVAPVAVWGLGLLLRGERGLQKRSWQWVLSGWSGVKRICGCMLNQLARQCPGTGRCLPPPHASLCPYLFPLCTSHE
jgi:hypothetical protein